MLGCRIKANYPHVGPGPTGRVCSVGIFPRGPSQYLLEFRRKTTENSEWLSRQARPGIESGTSCLPVLSRILGFPKSFFRDLNFYEKFTATTICAK